MVLAVPVANPKRILVLGDTGCRIKGAALQACNDPAAWPFPQLAAAAAKLKPDLVIHVGDYLYRESACPAGNAGCAGSPWGDNWTTWQADFYTPAAPLLAAAPIVLVRGNHEDCRRAGPGFQLLHGPRPRRRRLRGASSRFIPWSGRSDRWGAGRCRFATKPSSTATWRKSMPMRSPAWRKAAAPVWLVHHRPIWAAITGPLGIPIGGNLTLMDASRINAQKGAPLIPHAVELMLSGHIHTFEAINFNQRACRPRSWPAMAATIWISPRAICAARSSRVIPASPWRTACRWAASVFC